MNGGIIELNRRSNWQNKLFGIYARERDDKWAQKGKSVAADRYTLLTPSSLSVAVGGKLYVLENQAEIDLSAAANWDTATPTDYTVAANRAGKDFYIYAVEDTGSAALKTVLSANSTVPDGYTASNSRKIGGFHCLCVAVGTISGHALTGFIAGDILPDSIWDYNHKPISSPEGMVYANTGVWVDIYLPSVSAGELVSAYNATIADGVSSEKFHCYKHEQWFARIGKKTISQLEFVDASLGSNQGTNIAGSTDPATTGGHSDTAGDRMISNIGCEDMCGALSQYGRDTGGVTGGSSWRDAFDAQDSGVGGKHYNESYRPLLGGSWPDSVNCGSRCSLWNNNILTLNTNETSRGIAEPR